MANASATNATKSVNPTSSNGITSLKKQVDDMKYLKYDSNGSNSLYAILRLHNIPYLVTKGDKIILPTRMKGVKVGDQLTFNNVTTIGSPNFIFNSENGVNPDLFEIKGSVVEITKEPYYEVYRKKQRCRRLKTIPVQNYQTILMINELKLN
ncbi:hypothetical protein PSN45_004837 [Yamadazyma tenuis]|uniref:Large ribosomal subunit protein bL21m n=1 Tax=Candida tenuis (strain ATCC 10573 / BCRC 21748 / CBS 615 / JCM 9827 / NBRC 10315 / NRRL Y-1498 / VKM Y-70) TaxID=590646 RepID=G3B1T0_CANTC|nr:uncharacterized protein CANTEDRAFT_104085 [Yamadazyma tenuis ATCC 10573]EGV64524.1 hypothetical protein CANTEDRAFT_104085 [Yamadazyma tenuis ATCC 10573]WEJ97287.1 hypothetical protein PSN45_004837 [Yamadazyma tenuis]